ncbi:mycofactocin oligosaccharide methyltransferase MftM [Nocardioides jensenii]|uniref:mycofactocin oligosaccharide methyltransferase MftM n=1 Tax=Nocardioides jensenii TaxID=1843 RepID=UPI0008301C00|nr:mycofactocin oligosaccharide methyltransferase MftM [Nocardioides jensenii]
MSVAEPSTAIDPFEATPDGVYRDARVEVHAVQGPRPRRALRAVRTEHFDFVREGARIRLTHALRPEQIDDDLSGLLAEELFQPGWLRGPELFERLLTGIVLSTDPDPVVAWSAFYANTMARVSASLGGRPEGDRHGTIADYAHVYGIAEQSLAPGTALELGCCFGFLSLRLAAAGRSVIASDISVGTTSLLRAVAPHLGLEVETRAADAGRLPFADHSADNVLAIHLLEHLDAPHGDRVLHEALRVARRRMVVAVPLEDEADATWGHVRTISLDDLEAWGAATGRPYDVREAHGGWLIVDTAP